MSSQLQLANHAWTLLKNCEVLDVEVLSESAQQSLETLNYWCSTERKQHNLVLKTTDEIIQELERYFDTISASIETAKIGCHFTDEVAGLSKHVSKGRSMSTKDLRTFMASMLETANKASNQARVIEDKFGKIRVDLIKISGNVHSRLVEVGLEHNVVEARGGLCRAQEDLDSLSTSVVHFCIWWKNVADQLGVIETISHELAAGGSVIFPGGSAIFPSAKTQEVQERWLDVRRRYGLYMQQDKLIEQILVDLVQVQRKSDFRFPAGRSASTSSSKECYLEESADAKESINLADSEKRSKILAEEGRMIELEAKGLEEEWRQVEEIQQAGALRRAELEVQARRLEQEKKGLEDETNRLIEARKKLEDEERKVGKERRRVQEEIKRFEREMEDMEEGRRFETEKVAEIERKRKALEDKRTAQKRKAAEIDEALKMLAQEKEAADDQVPRRRRYERHHKRPRRPIARARSPI